MKILVTGCGGYLGNTLVQLLLHQGYQVRAVDNFYKGHCDELLRFVTHQNFEFMEGDVRKQSNCRKMVDGIDGIMNLAALVGVKICNRDPFVAKQTNVGGLENLLSVRKDIPLLQCSTDSVLGKIEGDDLCNEETPPNPQSLYGETKLEAEKLLKKEKNTIILRFATAAGVSPRMRANLLVNDLVYQAVTNRSLTIFQADFKRVFINVQDIARSLIHFFELLRDGDNQYQTYCIGNDDWNWSKRDLAEYIKRVTGCFVTYADTGVDPDCRDYNVSHKRASSANFHCQFTVKRTVNDLLKAIPLLQFEEKYQ